MPQLTPYALRFKSGLHVGTRGITLEEAGVSIPSDTLFSALLQSWMLAGGSIDDFIQPFKTPAEAPFLLTSAFPLAGDLRFYPMPRDLARVFSAEALKKRGKALKKIHYFSEGLLELALKGEKLDTWLFPEDSTDSRSKGASLQNGTLWLTPGEVSKLPAEFQVMKDPRAVSPLQNVWKETRVPRVTIERITNASTIYQAGRVQFARDCGLWFGVDWRKPDGKLQDGTGYSSAFDQALAILEDEGIGGERSSGYGAFKANKMKGVISFVDLKSTGTSYLLNRYIPAQDELPDVLTNPNATYELVPVSGWLQTFSGASQRRKRQWMVTAGSIVCPKEEFPTGCIADLKPDFADPAGELPHSVYRSGLALAIHWPR